MAEDFSWWHLRHVGSSAPDPERFVQSANAVGSGVDQAGRMVIALTRGEAGAPSVFVGAPGGQKASMLTSTLASMVGGKADRLDTGEEPTFATDGWTVVRAYARNPNQGGHSTQAGRDPGSVAAFVAASMPANSWVLVSVRTPGRGELRRTRRWFQYNREGMGYWKTSKPLLVSVSAAGENTDDVESFVSLLVSMLPGFDVDVRVRRLGSRAPKAVGSALLGAFASGGSWYAIADPRVSAVSAGVGLAGSAVFGSGVVPSESDVFVRSMRRGRLPQVAKKSGVLVASPRNEKKLDDGSVRSASAGSYPLDSSVLWMSPEQVASMACPHFGSVSGSGSSRSRSVPPALMNAQGPLIGWCDDVPVRLSRDDLWAGVVAFGKAGSGKSVFVHNLFGFEAGLRQRRAGRPKAMVVFESKSFEGAAEYIAWLRQARVPFTLVDVLDPSTPAVLLSDANDPEEKANELVSAMVYAFGEDSVGARSQNVLRAVFALAFQATEDDCAKAGLPVDSSPMALADVLLCHRGDDVAVDLHKAMADRFAALGKAGQATRAGQCLGSALDLCSSLYGPKVTPAQRRGLVEAPQSKVGLLMTMPGWWSIDRVGVSFDEIIANDEILVINTGPSRKGAVLTDEASAMLSSMLMFSLQKALMRNCGGWGRQGRGVSVFSDELSMLAGHSGEVFAWMRNQGRSFGVSAVLATQYPEQLPKQVQDVVFGFGTVAWFSQDNPDVIGSALRDLTKDGSDWTSADLSTMPRHHAVLRASVDQLSQPPVLVRMGYWDDNRSQFFSDQFDGAR